MSADTLIPLPADEVRRSLAVNDSFLLMKQERTVFLALKSFYEKLIVKDSIIQSILIEKDTLYKELLSNLRSQVGNQQTQVGNNEKIVADQKAIIRKKNWTIAKISGVSVTVIGVLVYMLGKK